MNFNVTFFSDEMCLVDVDLTNVTINDDDSDNDNPETTIHIRLVVWCIRYIQARHVKKRKASNYCLLHDIQQDGGFGACQKIKKETDPFLIDEK